MSLFGNAVRIVATYSIFSIPLSVGIIGISEFLTHTPGGTATGTITVMIALCIFGDVLLNTDYKSLREYFRQSETKPKIKKPKLTLKEML